MQPAEAQCPDVKSECDRRFEELRAWLERLQQASERHGESIAAIKAQLAMWAALGGGIGAVVGGGIVSLVMRGR